MKDSPKDSVKPSGKVNGSGKVNVNTATPTEMNEIAGITITVGNCIRAYRNKHGAFKSLEDLLNVPRFGPRCLVKYRDKLEV